MPEAKITRAEAAALVSKHLNEGMPDKKGDCHHYGRQEIRALLDAIYGEPKGFEELILSAEIQKKLERAETDTERAVIRIRVLGIKPTMSSEELTKLTRGDD